MTLGTSRLYHAFKSIILLKVNKNKHKGTGKLINKYKQQKLSSCCRPLEHSSEKEVGMFFQSTSANVMINTGWPKKVSHYQNIKKLY